MSQRQASRRAARVRWRWQAARLVADAYLSEPLRSRLPNPISAATTDRAQIARACLDGAPFDVAAVRAYCERLVAEGTRARLERTPFEDWTSDRGAGPKDHVPFAFKAALGWPGTLAREYGWVRCKACEGAPAVEWTRATLEGWKPVAPGTDEPTLPWLGKVTKRWRVAPGGFACRFKPRCTACNGRRRTRKPGVPSGFANGDAIFARTARRLLEALDGRCPWAPASARAQASECPECEGRCWVATSYEDGSSMSSPSSTFASPCGRCRGTGHNLAGVLPRVEYPTRWRPVVVAFAGEVPAPGEFAAVTPAQRSTMIGLVGLAYQLQPAERRSRVGDALASAAVGQMFGRIAYDLMSADLVPGQMSEDEQ